MSADLISLYTTRSQNDTGIPVRYYHDYTGQDCLNYALQVLNMPHPDPRYGLLLQKSIGEPRWIDLRKTLRQQLVDNGDQIMVYPISTLLQLPSESDSTCDSASYNDYASVSFSDFSNEYNSLSSFNTSGPSSTFNSTPEEITSEPTIIQAYTIDSDDDLPVQVDTEDDDESSEGANLDISLDTQINDFATANFGALRLSEFNTGSPLAKGEDTLEIFTCEGFGKIGSKTEKYYGSYGFEDTLSTALSILGQTREGQYAILLEIKDKQDYQWFKPGQYLEDLNPRNGMILRVFKREKHVKVCSPHFEPKVMSLDITLPISELVKIIAQKIELDNYIGFSLYSLENIDKPKTLDGDLSLPEQTHEIKKVLFHRQYFLFTREDLSSLRSAVFVYKDAMNEFTTNPNIYIKKAKAEKILPLMLVAESENGVVDWDHVPADQSNRFPPDFKSAKTIGTKLKGYQAKFDENPFDRFNAICRLIKFFRRLYGFGCKNFEDIVVQVKYGNEKHKIKLMVQTSPLCLRFYNLKENVLEERINYTKIISMEVMDRKLEIKFSAERDETAKYTLIGDKVNRIKKIVEKYQSIINDIEMERAKELVMKAGGDLTVINPKNQIHLFTSLDMNDPNPKKFTYDSTFTREMIVQCAEQNLQQQHDDNHVIFIKLMDNVFRWIRDDQCLKIANIQDGMHLYLLTNYLEIKIHLSDDQILSVPLDITKPIEDLTPCIFEKKGLPPILGYTFYTLENGKPKKPLDTRFSIPEQCTSFEELAFRRRFYVLSGEVLQTPEHTYQAAFECHEYLLSKDSMCKISEDQAILLGVIYLYASVPIGTKPETVAKQKINVEAQVPKYIKVNKKFVTKFNQAFESFQPIDKWHASKKYIGKIRLVAGFGEETFRAFYTDVSYGSSQYQYRDATLSIGPMRIVVTSPSVKVPLLLLSYKYVTIFQSMNNLLSIKYNHPKTDKPCIAEIKVKEMDVVIMLISYNIKIITDLSLAKQNRLKKQREEDIKRLNGEYEEKGYRYQPMIDFFISTDLSKKTGLPKLWLEVHKTGKEVVDYLRPMIVEPSPLDPSKEYIILLLLLKKFYKWVYENATLKSANPYRNTILYVIEAFPEITILFSGKHSKKMIIEICKKISEIIPMIAKKMELAHSLGFTLYKPIEGKKSIPLKTDLSIPEQIPEYSSLEFKRRFFVITKYDLEDDASLIQTYYDVKELVLTGKVDMTFDNAIQLMFYSICAEPPSTQRITKDNIVPKDFSPYLPVNIKPQMKGKKLLLDDLKKAEQDFPQIFMSNNIPMRKYIDYARSLPTFGTERFQIVLVQEKKNQRVFKPAIIFIAPWKVFITDEKDTTKIFYDVEYKRIIKVETVEEELSIKYSDEKFMSTYIDMESPYADEIASLIMSHIDIHHQLLVMRMNEKTNRMDRIDLCTYFCHDLDRCLKKPYDLHMTGAQLIAKACQYLELDPNGQYSCLLRLSEDEYRWINKETILGTLNPYDGLSIYIYHTYMPVTVTLKSGFMRKMLLNIEKKVIDLIDEVAFKTYTDCPIGYTLYYKDRSTKQILPLDLDMTIPEQTIEFSSLLFQRRFYKFTKKDIDSQVFSLRIYKDVRENIISGNLHVKNDFLERFALLDFVAQDLNTIPEDLTPFFPSTFEITPKVVERLKEYFEKLRLNPSSKPEKAARKYIYEARNYAKFGCESYEGYLDDRTDRLKPKKKLATISIGPVGVHIQEKADKGINYQISFANIVTFQIIKDRIYLQVKQTDGQIRQITLVSKDSTTIFRLLHSYKDIISEKIINREIIQNKINDPIFKALKDHAKESQFPLFTSMQLDHPNPPLFSYCKEFDFESLVQVGLFNIVAPQKDFYFHILTTNKCDGSETKYQQVGKNSHQTLDKTGVIKKGHLFIVPEMPNVQVITNYGFVNEQNLLIKLPIIELCEMICKQFELGMHFGYTFYEVLNDEYRPLDFTGLLHEMTPNYVEALIKRRFLVFSKMTLADQKTLETGYRDVKENCLANECVEMELEQALKLSLLSLIAETKSASEFLAKVSELKENGLAPRIPTKFKMEESVLRRFKAMATYERTIKPQQAMFAYIVYANHLSGYGAEKYHVFFTNRQKTSKIQHKESFIILNPYKIEVFDFVKRDKVLAKIDWRKIINYSRTENQVEIVYNDNLGIFCEIIIESEFDSIQILSFIHNMCEILKMPEFISFPDFDSSLIEINDGSIIDQINFNDDFTDASETGEFSDITGIEGGNENNFDIDSNIDFDEEFGSSFYNNQGQMIDAPSLDEFAEDYSWRASDDGLSLSRAQQFLDSITADLGEMKEGLGDADPNDIYGQLSFYNDQLQQYGNDLGSDYQEQFGQIADSLNTTREITKNIIDSDMEISQFIPDLVRDIDSVLSHISLAKIHCDTDIETLRTNYQEKKEELSLSRIDLSIARSLLSLSNIQESLVTCLHSSYPFFCRVEPNLPAIITQIQSLSANLTEIARQFMNGKADPKLVTNQLKTIFDECMKLLDMNKRLIDEAAKKKLNVKRFTDINNHFSDLLSKLMNSKVLKSLDLNPKDMVNYQMYAGDLRHAEQAIAAIYDIAKYAHKVLKIPNFNKPSLLIIHGLGHQLKLLEDLYKELLEKLNVNPNDEIARSEAIAALQEATNVNANIYQEVINSKASDQAVERYFKRSKASIKVISDIECELSSINIIPVNMQNVIDDLEYIISRDATLSQDIKNNLPQDTLLEDMIKMLQDHKNMLDRLLSLLQLNSTNGSALYKSQQRLLKIRGELPMIKKMLDNLSKATDDKTYKVIYERLESDLMNALTEGESNEDISKIPHLMLYQTVQPQTARLNNQLNYLMTLSHIKNNAELLDRLHRQTTQLQDNYLTQVQVRKHLLERPFNRKHIESAYIVIKDLLLLAEKLKATSRVVSDQTSNVSLDGLISRLETQAQSALNALIEASKHIFHLIPNQEILDQYSQVIGPFSIALTKVGMSQQLAQWPEALKPYNKVITNIRQSLENLVSHTENPGNDFYQRAAKLIELLRKFAPYLYQIDIYQASPVYGQILNQSFDYLVNLSQISVPTLKDAKLAVENCIPIVKSLRGVVSEFENMDQIKNNEEYAQIVKNWSIYLKEANNQLKKNQKGKYTIKEANEDKRNLVNIVNHIREVPNQMMITKSKASLEKLGRAIGVLSTYAMYAIDCIRMLPLNKKIVTSSEDFNKFGIDDEIEEMIEKFTKQISKFKEFFSTIVTSQDLTTKVNTIALIKQMIKIIEIYDGKDDIKKQLTELKNQMTYLQTSTDLISPIIGDMNCGRHLHVFGDNLNLLLKLLLSQHITKEIAPVCMNALLELLEPIPPSIEWMMERSEVKKNKEIWNALLQFRIPVGAAIKELAEAKPRKMQRLVDDLYSASTILIPTLHENVEYDRFMNQVVALFEECAKYTSLPLKSIRFTDSLLIKKNIFSDDQIKSLTKECFDFFSQDLIEPSSDLLENLIHALNYVADNHSFLPLFISHAAVLTIPMLNEHDVPHMSGAIRTIIQTVENDANRLELLQENAVKTLVKASHCLNLVKKSLMFLKSSQQQFSIENKFYFNQLEKAIRNSDTSLLIQCQSFQTAVFIYPSLHMVNEKLQIFIQSISDIKTLQPIVKPLKKCCYDFSDWLFMADLGFMALFEGYLDNISIYCDDNSVSCSSEFLRDVIPALRHKERGIAYNVSDINNLGVAYKKIKENIPENFTTTLEKLNPIINFWTSPPAAALLHNLLRSAVESNSIIAYNKSIKCNDVQFFNYPIVYAQGRSKLSLVTFMLTKASENGVKVDELLSLCREAQELGLSLDQDNLLDLQNKLELILDMLAKTLPIDYTAYEREEIDLSLIEQLLSMIDDPNCLAVAKESASLLKDLLTKLKSMKPASEITSKHEENDPMKHFILNPLVQDLFDNFSVESLYPIINTKQEDLDMKSIRIHSSHEAQKNVLEEFNRLSLTQKLNQIQQNLYIEFPSLDQDESVEISPQQISDSLISIQHQYEALNSQPELHKIQSRLSADNALIQSSVLTHSAVSINQDRISMNIDEHNIEELLSTILSNIKNIGPVKPQTYEEASKTLTRNLNQILLIEQLITIQQLSLNNLPEVFKYAQSQEGKALLVSPIQIHQLLKHQQAIIRQVSLCNSKVRLSNHQRNMNLDDLVIQFRIINNMLDILTKEVIGDSIIEILTNVNMEEQEINQTAPENLKLSTFNISSTIQNAQNFCYSLISRMTPLDSFLAMFLDASHIDKRDLTEIDLDKMINQKQNLISLFKNEKEIDKLSLDDLMPQRQLLNQLITIFANNELFVKYSQSYQFPDFSKQLSSNFALLQTSESLASSFSIEDVVPLYDAQIYESYHSFNNSIQINRAITQDRSMISLIDTENPTIKSIKASIKQDELPKLKNLVLELRDVSMDLKSVQETDLSKLYHMLINEISLLVKGKSMNHFYESHYLQSLIFDQASLMQRQHELEFLEGDHDAETIRKEIENTELIILLCKLAIKRIELYPDLRTVSKEIQFTQSEIESYHQSIRDQLDSMKQNRLQELLKDISNSDLINQQIVINHLISSDSYSDLESMFKSQKQEKTIRRLKRKRFSIIVKSCEEDIEKTRLSERMNDIQKRMKKDKRPVQVITNEKVANSQKLIKSLIMTNQTGIELDQILTSLSDEDKTIIDSVLESFRRILKKKQTVIHQSFLDEEIESNSMNFSCEAPDVYSQTSMFADSHNGLISLLPAMSHVPISECMKILITENQGALKILNKLYDKSSTQFDSRINNLLELSPQLVSSYARVQSQIQPEIKSLLVKNPLMILEKVQILINTASLSSKASECRKTLSELLSMLNNIGSAISPQKNMIRSLFLACISSLVISLRDRNVRVINLDLIKFNSLLILAKVQSFTHDKIMKLQDQTSQLQNLVFPCYTNNTAASPESVKLMDHLIPILIGIVNEMTDNPFLTISSLKTLNQVTDFIYTSQSLFDKSVTDLTSFIQQKDREGILHSLMLIIKSIADSEAAMAHSLKVTSCKNLIIFNDFFSLVTVSVHSIQALVSMMKSTTVSATSIKRSTRSFSRMLNSLIDLIEECEYSNELSKEPETPLLKSRVSLSLELSSVVKILASSISARACCKIPETFAMFISQQSFNKDVISSASLDLLQYNTDKNAGAGFCYLFDKFMNTLSSYKEEIAKLFIIQDVTNYVLSLSTNVCEIVETMSRLTDVIPIIPDFENAERLSKHFTMPHVPSKSAQYQIKRLIKKLSTQIKDYDKLQKNLFELNANKSNNTAITDEMLNMRKQIHKIVQQILRISTKSYNLELQSNFAQVSNDLVSIFDTMQMSLRNKLLLTGDWDIESPELAKRMNKALKEAQKLSKKAGKLAEEEESAHNEMIERFNKILHPLGDAISQLEALKPELEDIQASMSKEWATRMLEISLTLYTALNKYILHIKSRNMKLNSIQDFATQSIAQIDQIVSAIRNLMTQKSSEPELQVIQPMKEIGKLGDALDDQDALKAICKGALALSESAENSLNARKSQKGTKKVENKQDDIISIQTKNNYLMTRLELESRVIRARILLERSEKQLTELD